MSRVDVWSARCAGWVSCVLLASGCSSGNAGLAPAERGEGVAPALPVAAAPPPAPASAAPEPATAASVAAGLAAGDAVDDEPDQEDVLNQARSANDAKSPAPGHGPGVGFVRASNRRPKPKLEAGRFELRLPDAMPVLTPTVHRGLVIAGSGNWTGAVRADSGEVVWAQESRDPGPSSAACEDDLCAWNTESCTLIVADAASGEVRWHKWIGALLMSAPSIAGGRIYSAYSASTELFRPAGARPGATHGLASFDLASGKTRWRRWIDRDLIGAPVVDGGTVYAATYGGTLYAIDGASGEITEAKARGATSPPVIDAAGVHYTRFDFEEPNQPREIVVVEPAAPGERPALAIGSEQPGLLGVRPTSVYARPAPYAATVATWFGIEGLQRGPGTMVPGYGLKGMALAPFAAQQAFQGSRILRLAGHSIAVFGDELVAFEGATVRWVLNLGPEGRASTHAAYVAAPPAAAGGRVVVARFDGVVLVVDPDTGAPLAHYDVGHPVVSQPAVMNGWIYVGTTDGLLVGIDTGDPTLSGWATAGGDAQRSGRTLLI